MGNCCRKLRGANAVQHPQSRTLRIYEMTRDGNYYSDVTIDVNSKVLQEVDKQTFTFYNNNEVYCDHFPVSNPTKKDFLNTLRQRAREKRIPTRQTIQDCTDRQHYIVIL